MAEFESLHGAPDAAVTIHVFALEDPDGDCWTCRTTVKSLASNQPVYALPGGYTTLDTRPWKDYWKTLLQLLSLPPFNRSHRLEGASALARVQEPRSAQALPLIVPGSHCWANVAASTITPCRLLS